MRVKTLDVETRLSSRSGDDSLLDTVNVIKNRKQTKSYQQILFKHEQELFHLNLRELNFKMVSMKTAALSLQRRRKMRTDGRVQQKHKTFALETAVCVL